ncbi:MAG TPA: cytochrome P450 [Gammaproteobacteria bacterium]|nr:cytochrome P450 [Gammaproteobacteria bacterium]
MTSEIPAIDLDMFDADAVRNARAVDDAVRETAPVVYLKREGIAVLGRFEHVSKGLADWQAFSSTSRPWHDPSSVRPEILLTDDPPRHTEVRSVVAKVLSPKALNAMTAAFKSEADTIAEHLVEHADESIDAVEMISRRFVYKVLPDLMGLPAWGRENMAAFGHMVWATLGPQNQLFREAMVGSEPVLAWVNECCNRENLDPNGLGMQMFYAADRGEITQDEAKLLVQILLSAAADTTVMTLSTAIRAFCEFPDQYELLRADPSLLRAAFDESLRWDSPSRFAGRITARDIRIDDYVIPQGTRCGLLFAAANRDPRKWQNPERFDIRRDLRGHVGWGYGVHACVGRTLAQLEADAMLGALLPRIESFEATGDAEPWMTTIGHGPVKLPIRVHPAARA